MCSLFSSKEECEDKCINSNDSNCGFSESRAATCYMEECSCFICDKENKIKLQTLVLEYTGINCDPSKEHCHNQFSKASVSGVVKNGETISMIVSYSLTSSSPLTSVAVGTRIDLAVTSSSAELYVRYNDGSTATVELHTSCSVEIRVGDKFGPFKVVSFLDEDGASEKEKCSCNSASCRARTLDSNPVTRITNSDIWKLEFRGKDVCEEVGAQWMCLKKCKDGSCSPSGYK